MGPVDHLLIQAARCLGMIVSFVLEYLFAVLCLCSHFHDHSVVGRSTIRDAMAGIVRYLRIYDHHRPEVTSLSEPLITERLYIQINMFA